MKQTMLGKLEALIDSYVNNSEVVTFFRVFSGNEFSDFFLDKMRNAKEQEDR